MKRRFSDENLIFLVSQPRAGSTLLQAILAGLDDVCTTPEPWIMLHPIYALRETGYSADYNSVIAHRALEEFWQALPGGRDDYLRAIRQMGLSLYGAVSFREQASHFLDKTPRYYTILSELTEIFPEARFIFLYRNPLAVLASILSTWVNGQWSRLSNFHDDLLLAPGLLLRGSAQLNGRAFVTHYEKLVTEPEVEIGQLCDWLGMPYDPALLDYGNRQLPTGRYGDLVGIQGHNRPSDAGLNRWLDLGHDPTTRHLALVYLEALGPQTVAGLGYDIDSIRGELEAIECRPGKPKVTWQQTISKDRTVQQHLRLIAAEARHRRHPGESLRRVARLILGKP